MPKLASQPTRSPAKRARVEAARRSRRIIFNDDTHELALEDAGTPEGFLAHRIVPLAGTHVGTISWSVLGGQFDAPVYDSKIQPIYGDAHGGPLTYWTNVTENVKALVQADCCPLQLVIDFAHNHDMETFASVRMNDVHDSFMDPNGQTIWKRTHPEYMVDTCGMLPQFELYTSAQDFSHEAVRARKLDIIGEICERYDVDGFELDYIRHPVLFSRRMRGEPCTPEEIEIMTGLMRRIRALTEAAAERRGRPLLIATRVPDTFARSLDCGLDLKRWLEEDFVDILIAGGGYAPFSLPAETFVEAAHPHGVPVYPCVNQGMADTLSNGHVLECVRGLASNWYRAGADGLYFWNLGTPFEFRTGDDLIEARHRQYTCLDEVGDPEALTGKDKLFCVDNGEGAVMVYYAHVSSPWPLPIASKRGALRTGVIGRVPLVVGDDLEAHPPVRATLTVDFDNPAWQEILFFRLNGHELPVGRFVPAADDQSTCRLDLTVTAPPLRTGRNLIEIGAKHVEIPEGTVNITAMKLEAAYEGWRGDQRD